MRDRGHDNGFMLDAIGAVDIALWDVRGKALNLPLSVLLGGGADDVPVYVSGLVAQDDGERRERAAEWRAQGFTRINLHQGFGVEADLRTFDVVQEAVGAARLVQPDLGRIGVTETVNIAALAAAHHVPVALHASTGMGILTAANVHVAAAIPN